MSGPSVVLRRWAVPLLALAGAFGFTIRTHAYFLFPYAVPLSNDEGYIASMALRMARGHWLPYVDAVSQRGPITYWLCTAVMSVFGLFSWAALRWLALALALGMIALLFFLARALFSPLAGGIAVLLLTYFVSYELTPWDGLGYNGELVAMPFVLAAALVVARLQTLGRPAEEAVGRPASKRVAWLMAAGALSACAGLSKQVTLIHVGPCVLWLFVGPRDVRQPATRAKDLFFYALGFAAPYSAVLALYLSTGHIKEFIYYYQQYGRQIFMAPLTGPVIWQKLDDEINIYLLGIAAVASLVLFALARAVRDSLAPELPAAPSGGRLSRIAFRARLVAPVWFAILQFSCAALGTCFTFRFFGHYFLQFYPFLGLLAGYALAAPFDQMEEGRSSSIAGAGVLVVGGCVFLLVANSALHRVILVHRQIDRWYQRPQDDAIVRYVDAKTNPDDSIFVWGFHAETYISARRYPASRFVYTVYPAGIVPWFPATRAEEESRVVPGSQQLLLHDLEQSQPEIIVDAGRSLAGRYMYELPLLRAYLDRRYCFARYVDGEPVYRRRHGDLCPPPDY